MTDYYLNSGGGAASSPYANWTDAAATLAAIVTAGLTAGDRVFMHKDHTENPGAPTTWTGGTVANPVPLYRVDKDSVSPSDEYTPTTTTAGTVNFATTVNNYDLEFINFAMYGVYIKVNGDINFFTSSATTYIDCRYEVHNGVRGLLFQDDGHDCRIRFSNTIFDAGTKTLKLYGGRGADVVFEKCQFIGATPAAGFIVPSARDYRMLFTGCDLSGLTGTTITLVDMSAASDSRAVIDFVSCKFPTPTTLNITDDVFSGEGQIVTTWHSGDGSDLFPIEKQTYRGSIVEDTANYLTAGWVDADQSTNLSHDMVASSVCEVHAPLQGFDIIQWYASTGTVSVTVEAYDEFTVALQNDESYMEVYFLDGTDVLVSMATTQVKGLNTTANLTTSTAGWTGASGGRKVKFELTGLTIGKAGLITARIYLGKYESGKSLLVNPVMTIA